MSAWWIGCWLSATGAWAADAPTAATMDVLAYLDVPLTVERLHHAGATAASLAVVAEDATLRPYVRMRAASGLAFFPGETAEASLRVLALDTYTHPEVRISALAALSFLAASNAEEVFVEVLTSSSTGPVRDAAVRATARLPPERQARVTELVRTP